MHNLSHIAVKSASPCDTPTKLSDGGGLYLLIRPSGSKYWRYDYRFAGKRKTLALGVFPEISLAQARTEHMTARELLAGGNDPAGEKKIKKLSKNLANSTTFESIAQEWFAQKMPNKSHSHQKRTLRILEKDLFPLLGNRSIESITPPDVLSVLRKIENRSVDTAHRAKQVSGLVFRYAVAIGRAQLDPSRDLNEALMAREKKHHAAVTEPEKVKKLMAAISGYEGSLAVKTALILSALLFQRPGEIRHMEWSEINWNLNRWEIPAKKMKMKLDHIVPLASQSLYLLKKLKKLTGDGKYVFPNARGPSRPLSDNGVRTALRTLGYDKETMTPHGFRAMARTLLDEVLGFRVEWIEHQLSHAVKDATGRAYNRTTHLEGRTKMMSCWADYLEV